MTVTPRDAERLEECLMTGGVAVIPTDTVYGLVCDPDSAAAMQKIYELKRRPPRKPSAVMFFALDAALDLLTEFGPRTYAALTALLPGPVTLLLSNSRRRFPLACDPEGLNAEREKTAPLGLRVPKLEGPLSWLTSVGVPVLQSSANLSGQAPPRCLADVPIELCEGADLVLDGGELPGLASTVIDLSEYERSGDWRIVREGPLAHHELEWLFDDSGGD
ncbi:MAG: L-threonylcarbamoyladenylate synthase [Solirubrobacteraceae bacterium]